MHFRGPAPGSLALLLLAGGSIYAQVAVSGRVVDETGAAIAGARVELRPLDGGPPSIASSDVAGNFKMVLPASGEFHLRAERLGFYLYQNRSQPILSNGNELT